MQQRTHLKCIDCPWVGHYSHSNYYYHHIKHIFSAREGVSQESLGTDPQVEKSEKSILTFVRQSISCLAFLHKTLKKLVSLYCDSPFIMDTFSAFVHNKGGGVIQSKFRIAPDGRWQARPFTDRFGSSEADVFYQFPLVQGGTNVLLPTRCVDELYVNTAYPRDVSRVRELVP